MGLTIFFRRSLNYLPYGSIFDKFYNLIIFLYAHRRLPNKDSGLFNDYLYYLKTSSGILDILRQMTSDKIIVKDYVNKVCGSGYTIDTYRVFENVDEIKLPELLRPCVIKPAHGSGSVVFIDDDQTCLTSEQVNTLKNALITSPYISVRESNYKYLRQRLICEPMLPSAELTKDYKFFCFKGVPKLVQVDSDRHYHHKRNIYTSNWEPLNILYNFEKGESELAPICFSEMKRVASLLSSEFEFVRVDFFLVGDSFYVGEITHCPESAHGRFDTIQSERIFTDILFSSEA